MTNNAANFYIHRKGKAHGPCSLDELRTYLAYGSVKPDELVAEAGTDHWQTVQSMFITSTLETDASLDDAPTNPWAWLRQRWQQRANSLEQNDLLAALKIRRRVIRYRDWEKVPHAVRSTEVIQQMIVGFCVFPPSLWLACARVLSSRIIRPTTDNDGYLKSWPAAMQTVCTLLIVANTLAWLWGGYMLWHEYGTFVKEAMAAFMDSITQFVQDELGGRSH